MGLFTRRRTEDRTEDRSLTRSAQPWPFYGTISVGDLTPDDAMRISTVFAAVRLLARTVAQLPLVPYRRMDDGGRERYSGKIADLLTTPSPGYVAWNLLSSIVCHLGLWGNCYVGKFRDENGVVTQLAPLLPQGMTVLIREGQPEYIYYDIEGVQKLGTADVIHFRDISADGIVGLSPIAQCSAGLRHEQNLGIHADNFAQNGGRPGGILRIPGWRAAEGTSPEDVRSDWDDKFAGPANSGKLLIVAGDKDVQYQTLGMSLADAEYVSQRQLSRAEICAIFGLKSHLLNAPVGDRLHYSSSEQDRLDLLTLAVQPILTLIEQVISADPDLSPARTFCEFTVDSLLRADALTRAQYYQTMIAAGVLTPQEVRLREGLTAVPPPQSPRPFPTVSADPVPSPGSPNPPAGETP